MSKTGRNALIVVVLLLLLVLFNGLYVVSEVEQVIITQFGKPVGDAIVDAGLHFKIPFVQKANRFEKRWLEWDGSPNQIPTSDKKYIWVDTYARWRIADPLLFFQSVRDERGAQSRLDDILDGETRNAIASYPLIEVVRASKREMALDIDTEEFGETPISSLIETGREKISRSILAAASVVTPAYGIELVDLRIKRVNYIENVREKVYDRMISERLRIADKSRSEGQGRSAEIRGEKEKELQRIVSDAYRQAQEIRGRADAEAAAIYAASYGRDPELYQFLATLEAYKATLGENALLVTGQDTDFFRYLESMRGR
ncbi:MAG: protease modulator HflC [Candidatus Eisenbacteria bacterium]|nr:protease modulator HflC [Candidatus Eisenbacteria bacterium]